MSHAIALDAMGGDRAPREIVLGAIRAAREFEELRILLVGAEDVVHRELSELGWTGSNIEIVHAADAIGMGESPVEALRKKRDSSIARALEFVREGAGAFVSAGNTGACVAAATLGLRLLPKVRKAGIAVAIHAGARPLVIMDVGANVEARPEHLVQYGVMASLYAKRILGVASPRVGLLNIGEEGAKGNRLAKETHALFHDAPIDFVGNVEGNELFREACEVVVCDGFTGNVVLKVCEGLSDRLIQLFRGALGQVVEQLEPYLATVVSQLGGASGASGAGPGSGSPGSGLAGSGSGGVESGRGLVEGAIARPIEALKKRLDYAEFGGAPLLGVDGNVIIAHGRSDAKAIYNAIRIGAKMATEDISTRIQAAL